MILGAITLAAMEPDIVTWPIAALIGTAALTAGGIVAAFFMVLTKMRETYSVELVRVKTDYVETIDKLKAEHRRDVDEVKQYFNLRADANRTLIEAQSIKFEDRVRSLELFDAGMKVLFEQISEFRSETKEQVTQLKRERSRDMEALHSNIDELRKRLDSFANAVISQHNAHMSNLGG